jgi:DNA-binding NtrC family response regulator
MKQMIVITNYPDSSWLKTVVEALAFVAQVEAVAEQEVWTAVQKTPYDLILIDTSNINGDVVTLVKEVHQFLPTLPIVVFTTSPTWRRARELFLAGATDYVRRSLEKETILSVCQEAWERVPHERGEGQTNDSIGGE